MEKLEFKKITLEDKELFNKYFKEYPPQISEYTFSNLFAWQKSRQIEFCRYNDGLIIIATHHGEKYFMPPVGYNDFKGIISFLLDYGIKYNITDKIKRLNETQIAKLKDLGLNIIEDIDNNDYVYNRDDLAFLIGRKYSNKRGFIKKFCAECYHKYYQYSECCKSKCLELTEKWMETRKIIDQPVKDEYNAIKVFLENIEHFDATGGIICIDEKVAAFEFGEKLNKDTFVVHFEKADFNYPGIYQAINKLFVENEIDSKYKFVNREQDLGITGLRKSKRSYYPVKMIRKFTVSL